MQSCNSCKFHNTSLITKYIWKCEKLSETKRFNHPKWHGWFCEKYVNENEDAEKEKQEKAR